MNNENILRLLNYLSIISGIVLLFFIVCLSKACSKTTLSSRIYAGEWIGVYGGDNVGKWRLVVNGDGTTDGLIIDNKGVEFISAGLVDEEGNYRAIIEDSDNSTIMFTGIFYLSGTCNGTWSTSLSDDTISTSGTWVGNKIKH